MKFRDLECYLAEICLMFKARYSTNLKSSVTITDRDFLDRFRGLDIRKWPVGANSLERKATVISVDNTVDGLNLPAVDIPLEPKYNGANNNADITKTPKIDPDSIIKDLAQAFNSIQLNQNSTDPNNMKEQLTNIINEICKTSPKTNVDWSSVGGYAETKQKLSNFIKNNLIDSSKYQQYGLQTSKGLLLHGPSGVN